MDKLDNRDILKAIKFAKGFETDKEFAEAIGISPQNLYTWNTRNSLDPYRILYMLPDVSEDFVLNGNGPVLNETPRIVQTSNETAVGQNFGTIHNNGHGAVDANHYVPRAQYDDLMDKAKQLERRVHELTDEIISLSKQLIAKQQ